MAVTWNVVEMFNSAKLAVIVLNQPIHCPYSFTASIWERAVVRVTVDGGSDRWKEYMERDGTPLPPPHCVTGDSDSISPDTRAYYQARGVPLIPTPDQDETDFTKALRVVNGILKEKQLSVDFIICICEHSGRLDHTMANLETLYHAETWGATWRPVILSRNSLTWLIPAGHHDILVPDVCVDKALPCGLIPLAGPTTVTTAGLKWDLDCGLLSFGKLVSTSNTFVRTNVQVETSHNLVWTMQFLQDHSS